MKKILILVFCFLQIQSLFVMRPLFIEFSEMMDKSATIVVAHYQGMTSEKAVFGPYKLEVLEVIKGKVDTKIIEANIGKGNADYALQKGQVCVAFLTKYNQFEWVATSDKEQNIKKDILFLSGFYDYNAYLVYPSRMTLKQIKSYVKTEKLNYTIEGNLHFFSPPQKQMQSSNISFSVEYTYAKDTAFYSIDSENLNIIDFSQKPHIRLSAWDAKISVSYESNLVRPLKIIGEFVSEKDGVFQTEFWVEAPEEITLEDFKKYLKTPALGHIYYELEVKHQNQNYSFLYDKEIGRIGNLEGFRGESLACQSFSQEAWEFSLGDTQKLVLELSPHHIDKEILRNSPQSFIRVLRIKPLEGRFFIKKDEEIIEDLGTCKVSLKQFYFANNPNFKH